MLMEINAKIIPVYMFWAPDGENPFQDDVAKVSSELKLKDDNDIIKIPLTSSILDLKTKIKEMIEPPSDRDFKETHISPITFEKEKHTIYKLDSSDFVYEDVMDDSNVKSKERETEVVDKITGYNSSNKFDSPYKFEGDTLEEIYQKYKTTKSQEYELIIYVSCRKCNFHSLKPCLIQ